VSDSLPAPFNPPFNPPFNREYSHYVPRPKLIAATVVCRYAIALRNLADLQHATGCYREAEALLQRVLGVLGNNPLLGDNDQVRRGRRGGRPLMGGNDWVRWAGEALRGRGGCRAARPAHPPSPSPSPSPLRLPFPLLSFLPQSRNPSRAPPPPAALSQLMADSWCDLARLQQALHQKVRREA
jgi:hypothetical protein